MTPASTDHQATRDLIRAVLRTAGLDEVELGGALYRADLGLGRDGQITIECRPRGITATSENAAKVIGMYADALAITGLDVHRGGVHLTHVPWLEVTPAPADEIAAQPLQEPMRSPRGGKQSSRPQTRHRWQK